MNVRIIAASNRNLKNLVDDGEFREDLYYRLSVVTMEIPPLRERREDIPLLVEHFLSKLRARYNLSALSVAEDAMGRILQYNWPGNVRELENVIEGLVVLAKSDVIHEEDLPAELRCNETRIASIALRIPDDGISLEDVEKDLLLHALQKYEWNQTRAAKFLNISRKTLIYRMEKYSLAARETPLPESAHQQDKTSG